ncbi:MAG: AMP-binding protein, partial [Candidatus Competibacterales bacterium]|nr:AMP-binding protein [Candidatus Competibacterales bacterium]
GIPLAVMSPLRFLRRPAEWLWAIHRHRGTLSAAPNFAYALCLQRIADEELDGLDLSSLRFVANGAEPVSADTLRRFGERFAHYGLDPAALAPVYGLAECAVGLALPAPGRGLRTDRVQAEPLRGRGEAVPAAGDDTTAPEQVACGHALPGHEIRVVDEHDHELPDRRVGRLQFRGPSATRGYLNNPEATRELFHGDWLDSGDRGYLVKGEVYVSGRDKDVIIRGGRNFYPYDLEQAVGELDGIRRGCVAVFAAADLQGGTERLVVVAETRSHDPDERRALVGRIRELTLERLDTPPDAIELVPPQSVLTTSRGKIRRNALRQRYEAGALVQPRRPVWLQLIRLVADSGLPALRGLGGRLGERLYGAWAWTVAGALLPVLWSAVLLVPGPTWRWVVVRAVLVLALRITGLRPKRQGLERLPAGACVLAVNHSSYLDALLLSAVLPRPFRFVAKRELADNPLLRWPLVRLGVLFVERFDLQRSAREAERFDAAARAGAALAFFPEGTFTRAPGLLPFRMGAFVTAARNDLPVVPVTLSGTRSVLRGGSWLPRRAPLEVTIDAPIRPEGQDWNAAAVLARRTRMVMLERTGEPDLTRADDPFAARAQA